MCEITTIIPSVKNSNNISKIIKKTQILSSYQDLLSDESNLSGGMADTIYFPSSEGQICHILRKLSKKKIPVTVSGGRTGIVGSAIPFSGALLSLERMNKILGIEKECEESFTLWVEPGIRLHQLNNMIESKSFPLSSNLIALAQFKDCPQDFFYPPDPTEDNACLGGTVATNASGSRSFYYGSTRKYIKGLRVALTNGEILQLERGRQRIKQSGQFRIIDSKGNKIIFSPPSYSMPAVKNSCGYYAEKDMDIIDLFIGSEGTLGVICAIKLLLIRKPKYILAGLSFFTTEHDALIFSINCRNLKYPQPLSLEFFDSHCLSLIDRARESEEFLKSLPAMNKNAHSAIFWEFAYNDEKELEFLFETIEKLLIKNRSDMDNTWSGLDSKEKQILKFFRHSIPELINKIIAKRKKNCSDIYKISTDYAVPNNQLLRVMELYKSALSNTGLEYFIFGHIGENNLHINILPQTGDEIFAAKKIVLSLAKEVVSLNGSVAAEHGIGKLKHSLVEIQYGIDGIMEMFRIKSVLDPTLILGRGNIFPESYLNV
ncbi:MAG: FAD-binding oxidoreductase [bacterium]